MKWHLAKSKIDAVRQFLKSDDKTLVCTHATFRFAVIELGIDAFDGRLIAIDEFHHVSSNSDSILGGQLGDLLLRSLARSLYPDGDAPLGKRILKVDDGPLFAGTADADDIASGTIYVLRSQSDNPYVQEHREV